MSKDHFPVNDKTIADVNKANAMAYDSTPAERTANKEANPGKVTQKLGSMTRSIIAEGTQKQGLHGTRGKKALLGEAKATNNWKNEALDSADHVRESSQEHGESHDKAGSTPTGRYAQTPSHKIGETPKMSIKNEKIAAKIAKGLSKVMQRQG